MKTLVENEFNLHKLNKNASLMTVGNGYFGLRAAMEENYPGQVRGMYVAGIYNKGSENEPSDLVNLPDIAGMSLELDGEIFSLSSGEILTYTRELDLSTGELRREILWKSRSGFRFHFLFHRFAAKNDLHLYASKLTVTSLDCPATLKVVTGIDAQQTNFGRQHLTEESLRVLGEDLLQGIYKTTQSGHVVAIAARCSVNGEADISFAAKNRQLITAIKIHLQVNTPAVVEKTGVVFTSLDKGPGGLDPKRASETAMREYSSCSYDSLLNESALKWKQFWDHKRVEITSNNEFDQLAMDFAIYHIEMMTPSHDSRFSVGAKGLTGEGYKGHVFWDTEIFIVPFHLFTEPDTARKLLSYRYNNLEQAKKKAAVNGYRGALFPWESALTGEEETPEWAAINIRTGLRQRVASAIAEHHIAADIAYAVVNYYEATLDEEFMKKEGLELLKETARFWISRAEWDNSQTVIKDVIGPDEYTEHIDNNAYTNYMAKYNVEQALYFMEKYKKQDELLVKQGKEFLESLYLPQPNDEQIIPQDDTFLSKPEIDLAHYKENQGSQGILLDYSRQEVNEMQILKQADLVMLLYLMPDLFPDEVVKKNLSYYEKHTIHDSSLSKAIHAIVASRAEDQKQAYSFFQEACLIDLGPNPHSSDEGVHAASLGAIWMSAIFGFANVSIKNGQLSLTPRLPAEWTELSFPLTFRGNRLNVKITQRQTEIRMISGNDMRIMLNGEEHLLKDRITAALLQGND
ncbi:hypothetical glycosyl hydrolase [Bacillus sp. OV322]|uniref:glycoside hydrolase family 65 protein n=1 Tax=Bacillus sp. OV322 TaxID=1882764 RepID=UPI0008ECBB5E|nr:glycoside hydrolase family 65 protein [Bacillus sp. OV322]SFC66482.1 hypothetical glycosyl hydrolase [Bacillus sp. OV322]